MLSPGDDEACAATVELLEKAGLDVKARTKVRVLFVLGLESQNPVVILQAGDTPLSLARRNFIVHKTLTITAILNALRSGPWHDPDDFNVAWPQTEAKQELSADSVSAAAGSASAATQGLSFAFALPSEDASLGSGLAFKFNFS